VPGPSPPIAELSPADLHLRGTKSWHGNGDPICETKLVSSTNTKTMEPRGVGETAVKKQKPIPRARFRIAAVGRASV
jgi:hypothetical protein